MIHQKFTSSQKVLCLTRAKPACLTFNSSPFLTQAQHHFPLEEVPIPSATLGGIATDASEVWEALCDLNPNKALDINGIIPKLLRSSPASVTIPLH